MLSHFIQKLSKKCKITIFITPTLVEFWSVMCGSCDKCCEIIWQQYGLKQLLWNNTVFLFDTGFFESI